MLDAFAAWAEHREGEPPSDKDRDGKDGDCMSNLILITPAGEVREFEPHGWSTCQADFYAWGSGADFALGALAMGATVEQAVAVAIDLDTNCGGDIITLALGESEQPEESEIDSEADPLTPDERAELDAEEAAKAPVNAETFRQRHGLE